MTDLSKIIFTLIVLFCYPAIIFAQDASIEKSQDTPQDSSQTTFSDTNSDVSKSDQVKIDGVKRVENRSEEFQFNGRIHTAATLSFSHHIEKKYRSTRFGLDAPIEYFLWDRVAIGGAIDWTSISFAQDDPSDSSVTLTDHAERFGLGPSMTWIFARSDRFYFLMHDAVSFYYTTKQFSAENTFQLGALYMLSPDVGLGPSVSQKVFLSTLYDMEQNYLAEISFSLFL